MLRVAADVQTLLYMALAGALALLQWQLDAINPLLYVLMLALAFATPIMHHNHSHLPMWHSTLANRLCDAAFTLLQGHPGYVFRLCHVDNHHRHGNRRDDWTRTWRNGDHNDLAGLLLHPLQSACTLAPHVIAHLRRLRHDDRGAWRAALAHYLLLVTVDTTLLCIDWRRALLYVLVPQCLALYVLLAANYLQHAHTDERSRWTSARNFLGLVNPLCFNIGYHTAHHLRGSLHWSALPALHARIAHRIDPRLVEPGLGGYCARVFVAALFDPARGSRPLRTAAPDEAGAT